MAAPRSAPTGFPEEYPDLPADTTSSIVNNVVYLGGRPAAALATSNAQNEQIKRISSWAATLFASP
ncbi:hypothetical protein [Kibdelosporangium aridum]|uniref:hypothetical protein n=1 Tax=Kibdelosporangium aridum TaxID=2030 RepID=UPI0035E8287B